MFYSVLGCNLLPHPGTWGWWKGRACGSSPEKEMTLKLLSALIPVISIYFLRISSQEPACLWEKHLNGWEGASTVVGGCLKSAHSLQPGHPKIHPGKEGQGAGAVIAAEFCRNRSCSLAGGGGQLWTAALKVANNGWVWSFWSVKVVSAHWGKRQQQD